MFLALKYKLRTAIIRVNPSQARSSKRLDPRLLFSPVILRAWDPFLERPGNFSGPKANFEIKTCWILAQFQAHKLVNFVL